MGATDGGEARRSEAARDAAALITRRARNALIALLLLWLPAAASAAKPPPLPACFATGSGYGLCQGEVIPGGGSVTKLIAPEDSKGDFTLSGPAPLQSTAPVACGDAGCVYNHLNWCVGSGAVVNMPPAQR